MFCSDPFVMANPIEFTTILRSLMLKNGFVEFYEVIVDTNFNQIRIEKCKILEFLPDSRLKLSRLIDGYFYDQEIEIKSLFGNESVITLNTATASKVRNSIIHSFKTNPTLFSQLKAEIAYNKC